MENENSSSNLLRFFGELATYFRKENDLSDVTVALCNANDEFRKIFLKYFFPNIIIDDGTSIRREVPDDSSKDSRVDILINTKDKIYIIEVKIYDQNHHFGQYDVAYGIEDSKNQFGYITNYRLANADQLKKEGYIIKTWEDFYTDYCKNTQNHMIRAYGEYLKNVCGIDRYTEKMDIESSDSEPCLSETAQKIIVNYTDTVLATRYHKKYPNKCAFGFDFGKQDSQNLNGYAIFYANFCDKPEIALVLHARYFLEKPVLNEAKDFASGAEFFERPYRRNLVASSNVWIPLKQDKLDELKSAERYQPQKEILEGFFNEVLSKLSKYF